MKIALDFDQTITEDPVFWAEFIALSKKFGHEVTIVTFRQSGVMDNLDVHTFANENGIEAVFTGGEQKIEKFTADVWIDDYPLAIPAMHQIQHYNRWRV